MHKNHVTLELHFLLPHMKRIPNAVLWNELRPLDSFQYQPPLELNLCMLFHHARHHGWTNGIRLLLDFGFLLKAESALDWRRVDDLGERFGLSSPRLLFQAFPDFFPQEMMPPQIVEPTVSKTLRRLILQNLQPHRQMIERVMNDPDRFSFQWWRQRLKGMRPSSVRIQTKNPRGHYGRLLLGYISITDAKWKAFWRHRHSNGDSMLLQQLADEKTIEQYLQSNP